MFLTAVSTETDPEKLNNCLKIQNEFRSRFSALLLNASGRLIPGHCWKQVTIKGKNTFQGVFLLQV